MIIIIMARPTWPESCLSNCLLPIPAWFFAPPISDSKIIWEYQDLDHDDNGEKYCDPRHEICQNFTPPDFQAKDFTPLISLNFNSFSDKNTKRSVLGEIYNTGKNFYTAGGSDSRDKSHLSVIL